MRRIASPNQIPSAEKNTLEALANRAAHFYRLGHLETARQFASDVIARAPNHSDALLTLTHALRDMGHFDEALATLEGFLKLQPDHRGARAAYALTLFYKQDWPRAWRAFEVRFQFMDKPPTVMVRGKDGKPVPLRSWNGGPIPSSLLVIGEQGLGDTIQFARFLPLLAEAGSKVVLVVQRRLFRLIEPLCAGIELRPIEKSGSVQGISAWTPLMSLPQALDLPPEKFVTKNPYLRAEPERAKRWCKKLCREGFKIGIVWQGNPTPSIDAGRSAPLAAFAPLAAIEGVRLISLQKGEGIRQIAQVPFKVEQLGEDFDSGPDAFLDSAAVIENLDLMVSVDTSLAHLAGALGKPVYILLKRLGADWRWLHAREDTLWYPSAHLFRQAVPGDWQEVLTRVAAEMRKLAAAKAQESPLIPASVGEILDKLSILAIKRERMGDVEKRANVEREYAELLKVRERHGWRGEELERLFAELRQVNETLWDVEDTLREHERQSKFDDKFIELARSVYKTNDRRAALKRDINRLCGSALVEEKAYKPY